MSRRSRICCDGKGVSRRGNTSINRQNKITLQSHSDCVYLWTTTGRVLANHRSGASLERYTLNAPYPTLGSAMRQLKTLCRAAGSPGHGAHHPLPPSILYIYQKAARGVRATSNAPYPTLGSAMRQLKTLCRAAGSPRHGGPRPSLPRILYIYQKAARGVRATSNAPYPTLGSAMRQLKTLCRAAGSPRHGGPRPLPPSILYIYQKAARGVRATSNAPYPTLGSAMRQLKTLCRAAGSPGHGGPRPSLPRILYIYQKAARGVRATSNAPYPTLGSAMRQLKTLCRAAGSPGHGAHHPLPPRVLYIYQKAARGVRATSNAPYPTLGSAMRQLKTLCRAAGSPRHGGPRRSLPRILYIYQKAARGVRATSNAPYPTLGSAMRQLKTLCRAAGSPGHGGPRPSLPRILYIYQKAARGVRATSNAPYPTLGSAMRQLKTLCRAAGSPGHGAHHPLPPRVLYIYQKAARGVRATSNAPYPTLGSAMRQLKTLCRAAGSPRHGGPRPSLPRILYIYQKAARGVRATSNAPYPTLGSAMRQLKTLCRAAGSPGHGAHHPLPPRVLYIYQKAARGVRATSNAPYPTLGSAMRQLKTLCRAAGSPRHGGPRPSLPSILYIYQKAARGVRATSNAPYPTLGSAMRQLKTLCRAAGSPGHGGPRRSLPRILYR